MAITSPADVQRRLNTLNRLARHHLDSRGFYRAPRPVRRTSQATLDAIERVHAASLPRSQAQPVQAGPDKQKVPGMPVPETFTNRTNSGLGVDGGRYQECA